MLALHGGEKINVTSYISSVLSYSLLKRAIFEAGRRSRRSLRASVREGGGCASLRDAALVERPWKAALRRAEAAGQRTLCRSLEIF